VPELGKDFQGYLLPNISIELAPNRRSGSLHKPLKINKFKLLSGTARITCFWLLAQAIMRATSLAFLKAGINTPINNAMRAITTKSSIKVNPRSRHFPYDFISRTPTNYGLHDSTICGSISTPLAFVFGSACQIQLVLPGK
jgi:hypothetical protein